MIPQLERNHCFSIEELLKERQQGLKVHLRSVVIICVCLIVVLIGESHSSWRLEEYDIRSLVPGKFVVIESTVILVVDLKGPSSVKNPPRDEHPGPPFSQTKKGSLVGFLSDSTNQ